MPSVLSGGALTVIVAILPVECLKKGWYGSVRMAGENIERINMGVVPIDWRTACIVPLYKGRATNMNVATQEVLVC